MTHDQETKQKPGLKHWLFQILPPFLVLSVVFMTDNGSAFVFLAGLFVIPVLISLLSIIVKLIFFRKRKYYLLRPVLTVMFFAALIGIANRSYEIALEQAVAAAKELHVECNSNAVCPRNPEGWEVDDKRIQARFGSWFKYIASYYYKEKRFEIRVYQGPDLGDTITGGVGVEFRANRYVEK